MSSRKMLWIAAILGVAIPVALLSLSFALKPQSELSSGLRILQDSIFAFCPSGLLMFIYPDWIFLAIPVLSIILVINVVYYCVIGTFIWLGFNYNRAFWIPVCLVVPPVFVSAFFI